MDDLDDLKPARPDAGQERPSYMPSVPWRWVLGIGSFLALSIGTCHIRDKQEAEALRRTVLTAYQDQLAPLASRYQELVAEIRTDTLSAARGGTPETYVDPRLKLDALGSKKGLYMRVSGDKAGSKEGVTSASLDAPPDAIARCLGLSPLPAAELFARGSFLEKEWIARAHEADSVLKLRVVAEELRQRSERDLPFVGEALQASWFFLVVERGETRRDAPVDAYLWDLRTKKLLLRTRAQAEGGLVAARIAVGGAKPGQYASGAQTGAAQDCSIASQLRALAGNAPTTFQSPPPEPKKALEGEAQSATVRPSDPVPSREGEAAQAR